LRITGGELCGRTLKAPKGFCTRPTQDRVRESIFAVLGERLRGARVVDLFAGSGSLGFEAISRGSAECSFIEHSRPVASLIEQNAKMLGVSGRVRIIVEDASSGRMLWSSGGPYDIVLMDPPYASGVYDSMMRILSGSDILEPMAVVVVERDKTVVLPEEYGLLKRRRTNKYGATYVDFYQYLTEG